MAGGQITGGNMPDAPANFPTPSASFSGGYDPMTDLYALSTMGAPMAVPGAQHGDPVEAMAQNPLLQPLTGRNLPQDDEFQRMLPGHQRVANALSNAALGMSMIPTGMTIGQNIQGVSGAMTELPYARLMHAYQLLQPSMQTAGQQAGIMEQLMRGQYYGGRNMAAVEAMRQRDAMSAQIRAGVGKREVQITRADANDPNGRWKKGDAVMQYRTQAGVSMNPDGTLAPRYEESDPFMSYYDYTTGGGVSTTGALSRGAASYGASRPMGDQYVDNYVALQRSGGDQRPEAVVRNEGIAKYSNMQAFQRGAGGAAGTAPYKDLDEMYKSQNSDADKYASDMRSNVTMSEGRPKDAADWLYDSMLDYRDYKDKVPAGQTPMSPSDYALKVYRPKVMSQLDQIDRLRNDYKNLPKSGRRPDFNTYVQMQTQGGTPTMGSQPQVRDYTTLK